VGSSSDARHRWQVLHWMRRCRGLFAMSFDLSGFD
jgi:hypothetical protein